MSLQSEKKVQYRKVQPEEHINETLIYMLQHVDDSHFVVLFERCKPLLNRAVRRRFIKGYDREDLWQEACECFVEVTKNYDRTRGMCFSQYVSLSLDNHFNGLIRWNNALKRQSNKEALSLEGIVEQAGQQVMGISKELTPSEAVIVKESMEEYKGVLSRFEQRVSELYMKGCSYNEIAKQLNCSREKVMNAKHRCSYKFKNLFLTNT